MSQGSSRAWSFQAHVGDSSRVATRPTWVFPIPFCPVMVMRRVSSTIHRTTCECHQRIALVRYTLCASRRLRTDHQSHLSENRPTPIAATTSNLPSTTQTSITTPHLRHCTGLVRQQRARAATTAYRSLEHPQLTRHTSNLHIQILSSITPRQQDESSSLGASSITFWTSTALP